MGTDGGWPHRSTEHRLGQDFYKYMRTALTAVGMIAKQDHVTGSVPLSLVILMFLLC